MTRPSANESVEHTVKHSCGHTCFWSAPQAAYEALGPVDGPRFLGGLSTVPCIWCGGTIRRRLHGTLNGQGFDWVVSKTSGSL